MVLIPTLIFIKMAKEKRLLVTAKYGSLEFQDIAHPYNENAPDEQVETCLESIAQQIDDAGKAEMTEAFTVEEQIVEE